MHNLLTKLEEIILEKPIETKLWNRIKGYGVMIGVYFVMGGALDLISAADAQFFGNKEKIALDIGSKETKVFGVEDETTGLNIRVLDNSGPRPNTIVIIDNGTIADTVLTAEDGIAMFYNSPVTDVEDVYNNKPSGKTPTYENPQVSNSKFTMYANFGKKISEPDGTVIGEGKIYTIALGEEVGKAPIIVNNNIAIMHFNGSHLANAAYAYAIKTKYGVGYGKIMKLNNASEGAFNSITPNILKKLNIDEDKTPKELHKTNTTTEVKVTIESLLEDFNQIEKLIDTIQVPMGVWTNKEYQATEIPNGVTYTIIAKDLNSEEVLEGKEINIGASISTTNEKGEVVLENILKGGWGISTQPSETHYGFSGALFIVPEPKTFAELTDTLYVYLWNKDRPLPGTNETRRPTLYEIKEMQPSSKNLQRALGVEVHNLNETGQQLENARNFYAHVDSMVFNNEWGITLKTMDPFDYANYHSSTFSLTNIQNIWYNVITDGGDHTETKLSGDIYVARAPLQNYTVAGQAHTYGFAEDPEYDTGVGKEIVFRLGDYSPVGSRESVGTGGSAWFTEIDRVLLYSYLKHDRVTLRVHMI